MSTELGGTTAHPIASATYRETGITPDFVGDEPGAISRSVRSYLLPLVCLAAFLGLGTWLRTAQLGQGDFGIDEVFQLFAAQSLMESGEPRLPSGELYLRGTDVTRLAQWSMERYGVNEFAARLPSAVFGVLGLLAFAVVLWLLGGPWVAVVGTALFAVYPEAVQQSRELRFYTHQLLYGILALYTGWRAVAPTPDEPTRFALLRQWAWIGATLVLLLLATRVQIVSLSVLVGWGVCLLCAALDDLHRQRAVAWRRSPRVHTVLLGMFATALAIVLRPGLIAGIVEHARSVPGWVAASASATTPLAYYYSLSETYPLLLALLPLIFIAATLREGRLGVYLAIWFGVPLALHSLVLLMKGARFVLIPMLGLYAAAGIAAVWLAGIVAQEISRRVASFTGSATMPRRVVVLSLATMSIVAFLALPALHRSRKMVGAKSTRWTDAAAALRARPDLAAVPIGQTQALHPLYYWGRIDFVLGDPRRRSDDDDGTSGGSERESRVGVPILYTAAEIQAHYGSAGGVVIGLDTAMLAAGRVDRHLADVLRRQAEDLCPRRCPRLNLYYWQFSTPGTEPGVVPSPEQP